MRRKKIKAMASTRLHSLFQQLQELFQADEHEVVCGMQDDIDECMSNEREYADTVFILAGSMSILKQHEKALYYYKVAHKIHMRLHAETHSPPLSREITMQMQKQLVQVCASLVKANSRLSNYDEAQQNILQCIALHTEIDGHTDKCVVSLLQLANNTHLLGKHEVAIEIILDIFEKSADSRAGYIAVWGAELCPSLLMGQCYAALGRYSFALQAFICARNKAADQHKPSLTAIIELEYAVMLWVHCECVESAVSRMAKTFRIDTFIGAEIPLHVVEWEVIQLVATAHSSVQNNAGRLGICVKLNAQGDIVGVCRSRENTPGLREFMHVKWKKIELGNFDLDKFPHWFKLSISLGNDDYSFNCQVLPHPAYSPALSASNIISPLSEFITAKVAASQYNRPSQRSKILVLTMKALNKAIDISTTHELGKIRDTASFYLAFFVFRQGGEQNETNAVKYLYNLLQKQVSESLESEKCEYCDQRGEDMYKCESCMVMRFCCRKHQKKSWRPPFHNLMVSHKKICQLLFLCRSRHKNKLRHGDEHASTRMHAEIMNDALLSFLRTDIFEVFLQKHDLIADVDAENDESIRAHISQA